MPLVNSLKQILIQGEMLLRHNLADPTNVNHDLAFALNEEHVLMAISIDDVMTKQSILKRGDIVDIFITMTESVSNVTVDQECGNPTARHSCTDNR